MDHGSVHGETRLTSPFAKKSAKEKRSQLSWALSRLCVRPVNINKKKMPMEIILIHRMHGLRTVIITAQWQPRPVELVVYRRHLCRHHR